MENNKGENAEDNYSLSSLSSLDEEIDNPLNNELFYNSYTCNKCNLIPEITDIDFDKNIMKIKCPNHQNENKSLEDFINESVKHNYYFSVCNICNDVQKNYESVFKYCYDCKKIICNKCYLNHDKQHKLTNQNEFDNKCEKHFNHIYTSFCSDCKKNICTECKRSKVHKEHHKFDFVEIEPTENEINFAKNFCNNLKNSIKIIEKSGKKEIEEIKKIKNQWLVSIQKALEIQNKRINDETLQKKIQNERKYKIEQDNLKKKYELDLKVLKDNYEILKKRYEEELKFKLNSNEIKYNESKSQIESKFDALIIKIRTYKHNLGLKYNNIIQLNDILLNTYAKNKNQYFYILNVTNNINFIKKFIKEMPSQFLNDMKNKYNINIDEENINGTKSIISHEGMRYIISKMDKDKLKDIFISTTCIHSLYFLGRNTFRNLNSLSLINCNINKIDNLKNINCPQLKKLDLSENSITDISSLKNPNLKSLELLNLNNNYIEDINVLEENIFSNLKEIDLSYNKISDISVLNRAYFISIQTIILSYNFISINTVNFSRFKQLTNFKNDNQNSSNYLSKKFQNLINK